MKTLSLFLAAAALARADSHTSADYTIAADDLAPSGQRSVSADYAADQSVSDTGASGTSLNYLARQGYTGQLYDPAALTLTASPAAVSETTTSQLSAIVVNDDATFAPLPATAVLWSVVSGPVREIRSQGVLYPNPVYADTPARVRGQWSGLTGFADLTVRNTDDDNYRSYAADGVPDSWQVNYFGPDIPAGLAAADPDGDGQDNAFEYLAGLLPNDPLSHFDIAISTASPTRRNIEFGPLSSGRSYRLEASLDLSLWQAVPAPFLISDDGHLRILQDGLAIEPRKFYRIRIQLD